MNALPLRLATVPFADLRVMLHCDERTLRRKLRAQGIAPMGHSVPLAVLRAKWRVIYDSLLILQDPQIACPECGEATQRSCVSCDFVAA